MSLLSRWRVGPRLFVAFAIVVAAFGAAVVASLLQMQQVRGQMDRVGSGNLVKMELVLHLAETLGRLEALPVARQTMDLGKK